ncbi:MAG: indole-3-glycerol phosphate synthase TrpC, partial [bacterium]
MKELILDKIIENKKEEIKQTRHLWIPKKDEDINSYVTPPLDFRKAVMGNKFNIIAEIKRASPSAGEIKDFHDPAPIVQAYERGGACAVSVITESKFFKGSPEILVYVKKNIKLPVLRKDFIIDEVQIYESRTMGADSLLLIVAALDENRLKSFLQLSRELGMEPLVEAHTIKEAETALKAGAEIIGIN